MVDIVVNQTWFLHTTILLHPPSLVVCLCVSETSAVSYVSIVFGFCHLVLLNDVGAWHAVHTLLFFVLPCFSAVEAADGSPTPHPIGGCELALGVPGDEAKSGDGQRCFVHCCVSCCRTWCRWG